MSGIGGKWSNVWLSALLAVGVVSGVGGAATSARAASDTILYVKENGAGTKDGSSWSNAYATLQDALDAAESDGGQTYQIWLAAGTYLPTKTVGGADARNRAFQLKSGVAVYGGFPADPADGTGMEARDRIANRTILSGDLNRDDVEGAPQTKDDNAYHVFYHPKGYTTDETAVLDGVTITGGNADGESMTGGAIYNAQDNDWILSNAIITRNHASGGGAIFNQAGTPKLINVEISENTARLGGGIYSRGKLERPDGDGVWVRDDVPNITLVNVIMRGNHAAEDGGAIYSDFSNLNLTNATIYGNTADFNGGAIYSFSNVSNPYVPVIRNSIIWGNGSGIYEGANGGLEAAKTRYADSIVQGREGEAGVISGDPAFRDAEAGNFRLKTGSPAIDAGDKSVYELVRSPDYPDLYPDLTDVAADFEGNSRVVNGAVDLGAYEYQYGVDLTPFTTALTREAVNIFVSLAGDSSQVTTVKWAHGEYDPYDFPAAAADVVDLSFAVEENGTYSVYVRDSSGNMEVGHILIDNIATTPTIALQASTAAQTGEPIEVKANLAFTGKGNGAAQLRMARGARLIADFANPDLGVALSYPTFTVGANGKYTFYLKDQAGNEATSVIDIQNSTPAAAPIALPVITVPSGTAFTTWIYDPGQLYVGTFVGIQDNGIAGSVTGTSMGDGLVSLSGTLTGSAASGPVRVELAGGTALYVRMIAPTQTGGTFDVQLRE